MHLLLPLSFAHSQDRSLIFVLVSQDHSEPTVIHILRSQLSAAVAAKRCHQTLFIVCFS